MTDPIDSRPQYRLITARDVLDQAVSGLMKEDVVGVDVEADSMYHFTEQVCLIQIATASECLLIDPLAIKDLSPLKPLFQSPSITKIFHGASFDVRCLKICCDIQINNLFDSEIACRFLGLNETGLNSVVQQTFQVTLDKKYQKKDWSQRPLPPEMLEYAARDVLFLIPLRTRLIKKLEQKGRKDWVAEECRLLSIARQTTDNNQPLFLKVKGAGKLDRRSLAVLENLLNKRINIARKKNLPPFKIISNAALLRLAEEKPSNQTALRQSKILSTKQMSMYTEPVCRAIKKGLTVKEANLPVYPRPKRSPLSRKASIRVDALKKWRDIASENLAMEAGLVLPNALILDIARTNPQTMNQLDKICEMKEWQKLALGEDIIAVINDLT